MKPRLIRRDGEWMCYLPRPLGVVVFWIGAGYGMTPRAAYYDWMSLS